MKYYKIRKLNSAIQMITYAFNLMFLSVVAIKGLQWVAFEFSDGWPKVFGLMTILIFIMAFKMPMPSAIYDEVEDDCTN